MSLFNKQMGLDLDYNYNRSSIWMSNEPIIEEENLNSHIKIQAPSQPNAGNQPPQENAQPMQEQSEVKEEQQMKAEPEEDEAEPNFDELFNLPENMQEQEDNLVYRERKTRWGEKQIKRSKIQEDAIFNPLEALYSGNSFLPITQYGQAQLDIKMALYCEGRQRKSKWHHEIEKTFTPPMLNYISPNISVDQIQYLLRLYRLDELTSKMTDYVPDDADVRSPSPEPIYDKDGKRLNTREVRKRDSFIRERISLIEDCMKMRATFVPPEDYKPLKKFKKIYLTQSAINDVKANYIGKLIGPGGKTQKLIEQRSGCKIAVRGRGANKAHKDIFQNFEPLHIIIVGDNEEQLDRGVSEVQKILNGEEDSQLKQLLDSYNLQVQGIFKENFCQNCKMEGHRAWSTACPLQSKNRIQIRCEICGESSHITNDCPEKQAYLTKQKTDQIALLLESQYSQFKQDLTIKKPQGGANFITDFKKIDYNMLAIGQDPNSQQIKPEQQKGFSTGFDRPKKKPVLEEEVVSSALPKFEDE